MTYTYSFGEFSSPAPDQFTVVEGSGTTIFKNFGGLGRGANPSAETLSKLQTIKFVGSNLLAENMQLTQVGNNLEISFLGVDDTRVVLKAFELDHLENLPAEIGGHGNILFDGDTTIRDRFDVFNSDSTARYLFNRNTVTFLNALDNAVKGYKDSNDIINAQEGNDTVKGLSGDDVLRGGNGRDRLLGGGGDDTLVGDAGDDWLDGGAGTNILEGGAGNDVFTLNSRAGADLIVDYSDKADLLKLQGDLTFDQLAIAQEGDDVLMRFNGELVATLKNFSIADISANDFIAMA